MTKMIKKCSCHSPKKQNLALLEQAYTMEFCPSTPIFFLSFLSMSYYTCLFPLSSSTKKNQLLFRILCACPPTVNPYLSSAFVNKILFWGFFAFREHTGSSSGYMKTLLVARIQATCFGKQGNSQAVRKKKSINEILEQKRASQKLLSACLHFDRAAPI